MAKRRKRSPSASSRRLRPKGLRYRSATGPSTSSEPTINFDFEDHESTPSEPQSDSSEDMDLSQSDSNNALENDNEDDELNEEGDDDEEENGEDDPKPTARSSRRIPKSSGRSPNDHRRASRKSYTFVLSLMLT